MIFKRLPLALAFAFIGLTTLQAAVAQTSRTDLAMAVLERYPQFSLPEKQAAISSLAGRIGTASLLLDAVASGKIQRAEVPSFVARQIAALGDASLSAKLESAWGKISTSTPGTEEAAKEEQRLRKLLTPANLQAADASQGRLLFKTVCATCHTLFGEGAAIGPDLTGSNRADLGYVLENVTNPSAVLGKDYELHTLTLKDGRIVSGMIRQETESAFTVLSLVGQEVVAKASITKHDKPGISMMPVGLFSALGPEQVRDLVAYLASSEQVPMPGESKGATVKRVPGALEGESIKIISAEGKAGPQDMRAYKDGSWSGGSHLWWTGAKPGHRLSVELSITIPGTYELQAVMTRATDYGVFRFWLDGQPLSDKQIDLFGWNVTQTPLLTLGTRELATGAHQLTIECTGANPEAVKAYMFGLDYLWLQRK